MPKITRIEQDRIFREIIAGLQRTCQDAFDTGKVPAEWDGIELRQWIADLAQERYACAMDRKRKRDYQNVRACTSGL